MRIKSIIFVILLLLFSAGCSGSNPLATATTKNTSSSVPDLTKDDLKINLPENQDVGRYEFVLGIDPPEMPTTQQRGCGG